MLVLERPQAHGPRLPFRPAAAAANPIYVIFARPSRGAIAAGQTGPEWSASGRQLGLGVARADLRLHGGQLLVHLGVRARLVQLPLDVVGAAADVLKHAGLE